MAKNNKDYYLKDSFGEKLKVGDFTYCGNRDNIYKIVNIKYGGRTGFSETGNYLRAEFDSYAYNHIANTYKLHSYSPIWDLQETVEKDYVKLSCMERVLMIEGAVTFILI